jgi:hypothetical protein
MPEAEGAVRKREGSAEDMKAGAGAQLARKPHVKSAGGRYRFIIEPEARGGDRCRISQAVEIIGDREVFGDVAFPWSDDAAPSLRPAIHRMPLLTYSTGQVTHSRMLA